MSKSFTLTRLILAIVSDALEEFAVYAVWRWLLPVFGVNLHVGILIGVMVGWLVFSIWLFIFTTGVLKKKQHIGQTSMIGAEGIAASSLNPKGMVKIRGELWGAVSEAGDILPDEYIIVTGEKGLKLLVRKAPKH
jgi:membrane-bound ClpP family serine protease